MSEKSENLLFICFGILFMVAGVAGFFLFDNEMRFQFFDEVIEKNSRLIIVVMIGLIFTFFGLRGQMKAKKSI